MTVKPSYLKIIEEGTWSPKCSFSHFHTLNDTVGKEAMRYDGFWVRLDVKTPNKEFVGFGLPIIDLAYGRLKFRLRSGVACFALRFTACAMRQPADPAAIVGS